MQRWMASGTGLFRPGLLLAIVGLMVSACAPPPAVVDTLLAALPHEYWRQITDDEDALAICLALEDRGYQFDEFYVDEIGVEFTYPGGGRAAYPRATGVTAIVLEGIYRDFDSAEGISEDELRRLDGKAEAFCRDYQQTASALGVDLQLAGIMFWDFVTGTRGGYHFTENCQIADSYGWSFGSYAYQYELDPEAICPSGRVVF